MSHGFKQKPATGRETLCYAVFMHRRELERPKRSRRLIKLAATKLQLTTMLIRLRQSQWHLEAPNYQQQNAMHRECRYREMLRINMQHHMERNRQMRAHNQHRPQQRSYYKPQVPSQL